MRRLIACLLLAACIGKTPPVIDSAMVPANPLTAGTDGSYKVLITLNVHDDDDKIVALRTTVAATATRQELQIPMDQWLVMGPIVTTIVFPSNTPQGRIEIDFVIIDESGLESVPSKQFVTLQ